MKSVNLIFTVLASAATTVAWNKNTCNHDNVFRCLLANPGQATPFCQSYISVPIATKTIGTTTPVVTVTVTSGGKNNWPREANPEPTLRAIDMNARRQAAIMTALAKLQPPAITARAELLPRGGGPIIAPGCLTQVSSTSYPSSRISSACSCLDFPSSTVTIIATATPTTVTVTVKGDKGHKGDKTTLSTATPTSTEIPCKPFKISAPSWLGSFLAGILLDDFYTGFKLPYGEYDLHFTVDQATGYLTATAPNKMGTSYLVAYTGLLKAGNTIPYIVTESSPTGKFWQPLICRVGKDASGKFPLMCRAGEYTVPTLVSINGDGHKQLGIAKPGDKSGAGTVNLFAEFL